MDRLGFIVPAVAERIINIRGGGTGGAPGYCLRRRYIAFFEKGVQLGPERRRADTEEVHFIGGKGDHGGT